MNRYETHQHDVIVIGAGGAGLRAAIEASAGASVGLICKSLWEGPYGHGGRRHRGGSGQRRRAR